MDFKMAMCHLQKNKQVLIYRHKQFITSLAALVIVLAQFVALVHAVDHPFHHEDALCIPLQSAEQDKHFFHAISSSFYKDAYISDVSDFITENISHSLNSFYSPRAPPVTTI